MKAALVLTLLAVTTLLADDLTHLAAPVRVEAEGIPIDTEIGHAAPFVADFDGDGVQDLLVGQFGGGVLWVFRNEGTHAAPQLASGTKFQADGKDGVVPSG